MSRSITGGVAGHLAGHGKVGVVARCIIGHHEANKPDAQRKDQTARSSAHPDDRIQATSTPGGWPPSCRAGKSPTAR